MKTWEILMTLMIPLMMVSFGLYMKKGGPNKINMLFGYRTNMSMKNEDTWRFAHIYCGRLWVLLGLILLVISVAVGFFMPHGTLAGWYMMILMAVQVVVMMMSIPIIESRLCKVFDKNGECKQ